jgi:hypothetical protein
MLRRRFGPQQRALKEASQVQSVLIGRPTVTQLSSKISDTSPGRIYGGSLVCSLQPPIAMYGH